MRSLQRSIWADLLFLAAMIFGAFVRFNPVLSYDFVIKQGGMFAVMIDDLIANQFFIPPFTSYNGLDIPYAYPPVGFYLGGLVAELFGMTVEQVLRWVPALFATLAIAAFYLLALRLLNNKYRAAVATLFFALIPRAFSWFVTGGGLTRSPALFFMLLTLAAIVRLYKENRPVDILWAGFFGGLTVMSHPEAALHTVVSSLFLWVMFSRSRTGFVYSLGVAGTVLLVAAPWWATVISYHGLEPLLNAAQTGEKISAVLHLLFFSFTGEPYATLIAVFGLIGVAYCLCRRDYLLPLWLVLPFVAEGRSAAGHAVIPLAVLAAIGVIDAILPALLSQSREDLQHLQNNVAASEVAIFAYLLFFFTLAAYQSGLQLSTTSLQGTDREAMAWVRINTPEQARFLVLTGTASMSCDPVLEWFPALADRRSLYTVQGTEWTQGEQFGAYITSTYAVQKCLSSSNVSCLDGTVSRSSYEYLYVSKRYDNCTPPSLQNRFPEFLESMRSGADFATVYENDGVIILQDH